MNIYIYVFYKCIFFIFSIFVVSVSIINFKSNLVLSYKTHFQKSNTYFIIQIGKKIKNIQKRFLRNKGLKTILKKLLLFLIND